MDLAEFPCGIGIKARIPIAEKNENVRTIMDTNPIYQGGGNLYRIKRLKTMKTVKMMTMICILTRTCMMTTIMIIHMIRG